MNGFGDPEVRERVCNTVLWVEVAPWLQATPPAEVLLAASLFPVFMLPMLRRPLIAWCCRPPAAALQLEKGPLVS